METATLLAIRALAYGIIELIDGTLPKPTPPPKVEPNCDEDRHPAASVREAATMGHPNRRVCTLCNVAFEEGTDGETV